MYLIFWLLNYGIKEYKKLNLMNIKQTEFFLNRGLLLQLKHGEKWCDYSLQIKFLNKAEVVVIFCHNFFKLNPTFL